MGKLSSFVFMSLNGFYAGPGGDISWHRHGAEEHDYSIENLKSGSTLLFGRVTYELMAGYWPAPLALEHDPVVAAGMNGAEKIVFSRNLKQASWSNTRIVKDDIVEEVIKLKRIPGKDLTILGSGSIITRFAEQGIIDEYQFMVDPIVLGEGLRIFQGLGGTLNLALVESKIFKSGVVLLTYRPAEKT